MARTGSIAIWHSLVRRNGPLLVASGFVMFFAASALHENAYYILAASIFGVAIGGISILQRVDEAVLGTPWHRLVRITATVSLGLLMLATFGPLTVLSVHGQQHWDIPVLAGVLIVWWVVLSRLGTNYRRIAVIVGIMCIAWLPALLLPLSTHEEAYISAGAAAVAVMVSALSIRGSLKSRRGQYKLVEIQGRKPRHEG